jgi:hypothetical protein
MFKNALLLAVVIGVAGVIAWQHRSVRALEAEVVRLKTTATPNLSHVMADVAFQYANLWYAGEAENWPLARFYYNETRGRIRWFLRLSPTAKTPDNEVVDLAGIFDGVDTSSLADVRKAIEAGDRVAFERTYRVMLESCYSCHKSVGRPYLRPMVPTEHPQSIINYSASADWPR